MYLYVMRIIITESQLREIMLVEEGGDSLPSNFHKIPMGVNNYRSGQFTSESLKNVIKNYKIKNIVRLNPETIGNALKPDEEKSICESSGCSYHFIPSQEEVNKLLDGGNTLIHCYRGMDRTGGVVGGYLYGKGWDTKKVWDYTVKYNEWVGELLGTIACAGNCWGDNPLGRHLAQAQKFGVKSKSQALGYVKK